ncbi:arginine--tRNA ligase [Paenibacillus sp. FJAT-26967]|uniref:arginine--tRNA ligase domain-containing protein n=1 Tax=Paenibacillus sp. FJAT-26967 TaxID=1729690 RepID=UPI003461C2B6
MIHTQLQQSIEEIVNGMLVESGAEWPQNLQVKIEHPAHPEHGDYSTNIAMLLAKQLRRSSLQIAALLQERLKTLKIAGGLFAETRIAAPGFLNFYIDWQVWANEYAGRQRDRSGTAARESSKIVIEHTSINPNKSAHIGHLRNSCIGDTLARMLQSEGHQVEVHNYIDDLGNQLADTVASAGMGKRYSERRILGRDFCAAETDRSLL